MKVNSFFRLSNIEGGFLGQSGLCTSTLRGHTTIYKGQGGGILGSISVRAGTSRVLII